MAPTAAMCAAGIFPLGPAASLHVAIVTVGSDLVIAAMCLLPRREGRLRSSGLQAETWSLAAGAVAIAISVQWGPPLGVAQRVAVGCVLTWLCLLGRRLVRA